jgi:uncharacterized protein YueI
MEDAIFKTALSAIVSGDYCESDVKIVKAHLSSLNKEELSLKRKIEKETTEFVKNKDKHQNELKSIRGNIKDIRNVLKHV